MKFWDSSAIVPLVSLEEASPGCQRFLRKDPGVVVWALTPVEVQSALLRKRRFGETTPQELRRSRDRLRQLSRTWNEVQDLERVVERSIRVMDLHELRSLDALQLAALLLASGDKPSRLPFVVLDQKLAEAAEREGFEVLIP